MELALLILGFIVIFTIKANKEIIVDSIVSLISSILYK